MTIWMKLPIQRPCTCRITLVDTDNTASTKKTYGHHTETDAETTSTETGRETDERMDRQTEAQTDRQLNEQRETDVMYTNIEFC